MGGMTMDSLGVGGQPSAFLPVLESRQTLSLDAKTEMGPAVYSTKPFIHSKLNHWVYSADIFKNVGGWGNASHHSALMLVNLLSLGDT